MDVDTGGVVGKIKESYLKEAIKEYYQEKYLAKLYDKYNKKLGVASRIADKTVKEAVVSNLTGEIMAEPGETISEELAYRIEQEGVDTVILDVEGKEVKVFSNGMVDAAAIVAKLQAVEGIMNVSTR